MENELPQESSSFDMATLAISYLESQLLGNLHEPGKRFKILIIKREVWIDTKHGLF